MTKVVPKAKPKLPLRSVQNALDHLTALFYGLSGSGKTTLSGTFPTPMLILDVGDKGTDSISDIKDCDVMEVESWSDFEMAYWYLKDNGDSYKTVVIDTVTNLQQLAIEKVNDGDMDAKMSFKEWGEVVTLMKEWLISYRDLGINVVFLAQERKFNVNEDEGIDDNLLLPEIGPRLTPSLSSHLASIVSVVGNTFIRARTETRKTTNRRGKELIEEYEVPEYSLRVGPNPYYVTKVRKPKEVTVPDSITDPTYTKIINAIKGES
jgi:phage nucleotide-binding protein